jgi:hypothetical protein
MFFVTYFLLVSGSILTTNVFFVMLRIFSAPRRKKYRRISHCTLL